jgi:hypothetical protein
MDEEQPGPGENGAAQRLLHPAAATKCELANAWLTCPVFVTTAEFLPQHRHQLEQTQALIAQADRNSQQRLTETNRTVEKNLPSIIDGLTAGCCSGKTSCACTTGAPNAS